jgi:hypothetical protein
MSPTKAPPTEPGRRAHCEDHPTCEYRLSAIEESRACSVREHADIYNEIKKKMSASLSVTLMGSPRHCSHAFLWLDNDQGR